MADEILEGGNTQAEQQVEQSGLPSDSVELKTELSQEKLSSLVKENGKILGQYESVDELLEFYQKQEQTHVQKQRELAESRRTEENQKLSEQQELEIKAKQTQLVEDIVPEFIENGMKVTDDMIARAEEVGISKDRLELEAYKFKDSLEASNARLAQVHEMAGGEEAYNQILDFVRNQGDGMVETYNTLIMSDDYGLALDVVKAKMGMKQNDAPAERIHGNTTTTTTNQGYQSRQEMFRDMEYLQSRVGRNDTAAQAAHRAKLAKTPENIWNGR